MVLIMNLISLSACDILPLVLRGNLADNPTKRIHRWIQKAIEFYICYMAQPPAPQETDSSPQGRLSKETHQNKSTLTYFNVFFVINMALIFENLCEFL